jgi:hypothetical protein
MAEVNVFSMIDKCPAFIVIDVTDIKKAKRSNLGYVVIHTSDKVHYVVDSKGLYWDAIVSWMYGYRNKEGEFQTSDRHRLIGDFAKAAKRYYEDFQSYEIVFDNEEALMAEAGYAANIAADDKEELLF